MSLKIGYIHIEYTITEEGDAVTSVDTDGDIPFVTQIGLLEMAKHALFDLTKEQDNDYDGL